jgi:putative methyltransferase
MSRLYLNAGKIFDEVENGNSLIKYCSSLKNIGKSEYALAAETLKYKSVIKIVFENSCIELCDLGFKKGLVFVMTYEILFGKGKIQGGGTVKKKILENIGRFKEILSNLMIGKVDFSELLPESITAANNLPHYIRINTHMISLEEGYIYILNKCNEAKYDELIPSLVKLPPNSISFGRDNYVVEGKLIIQDKASCFPSQIIADFYCNDVKEVLKIKTNKLQQQHSFGDIIDACASPGNKTNHLIVEILTYLKNCFKNAEIINHKKNKKLIENFDENLKLFNVFAFEKNLKRYEYLLENMKKSKLDCFVDVKNSDFLTVDVDNKQYNNVKLILVDPSCSGSGVVRAWERVVEREENSAIIDEKKEENRVKNLHNFQVKVLLKAMSFKSVEKIMYSTCSIYKEENESVVNEILKLKSFFVNNNNNIENNSNNNSDNNNIIKKQLWNLTPPSERFKNWSRRGLSFEGLNELETSNLLRCTIEDETNGFFVAVFEKNVENFKLFSDFNAGENGNDYVNENIILNKYIDDNNDNKNNIENINNEKNKNKLKNKNDKNGGKIIGNVEKIENNNTNFKKRKKNDSINESENFETINNNTYNENNNNNNNSDNNRNKKQKNNNGSKNNCNKNNNQNSSNNNNNNNNNSNYQKKKIENKNDKKLVLTKIFKVPKLKKRKN